VAARTRIDKSRADANVCCDVTYAIVNAWPLPLHSREFPLKKLSAAPNSTEGVTIYDEQRRVRGVSAPTTRPNLLCQGLVDTSIYRVERLGVVDHLRVAWTGERTKRCYEDHEDRDVFPSAQQTNLNSWHKALST